MPDLGQLVGHGIDGVVARQQRLHRREILGGLVLAETDAELRADLDDLLGAGNSDHHGGLPSRPPDSRRGCAASRLSHASRYRAKAARG